MNPPPAAQPTPVAVYTFLVPSDADLRASLAGSGVSFANAVLARSIAWVWLVVDSDGKQASWVIFSDGSLRPYGPTVETQGLPVHEIEIDPLDGHNFRSLNQLLLMRYHQAVVQNPEALRNLLDNFDLHGHMVSEEKSGHIISLKVTNDLRFVDASFWTSGS